MNPAGRSATLGHGARAGWGLAPNKEQPRGCALPCLGAEVRSGLRGSFTAVMNWECSAPSPPSTAQQHSAAGFGTPPMQRERHASTHIHTHTCMHMHAYMSMHNSMRTCTHVHMHLFMYTPLCAHTLVHVHFHAHTCTSPCAHRHAHIFMPHSHAHPVHTYTHIPVPVHTPMHTHMYMCTPPVRTYMQKPVHVHTNVHICIHTYTCIHTRHATLPFLWDFQADQKLGLQLFLAPQPSSHLRVALGPGWRTRSEPAAKPSPLCLQRPAPPAPSGSAS